MTTELALILHLHTPQVRWDDTSDPARTWLTCATDDILVPLLRTLQTLRANAVPFRLALSVLPLLLTDAARSAQIAAGVAAFARIIGHRPSGMWLPRLVPAGRGAGHRQHR